MYNDFIKEIKERYKEKRLIGLQGAVLIRGSRDRKNNPPDRQWVLRTIPINEEYLNEYGIKGIHDATNKLPAKFLKAFCSKDRPFLFIPKGAAHNLEYETFEPEYIPPLSEFDYLNKKYSKKAIEEIMNDKVLEWRMTTGIELIHRKDTIEEQNKLLDNWIMMGDYSKNFSDNYSIRLFNMTNEEHHKKLITNRNYKDKELKHTKEEMGLRKILGVLY
jgi:hypothetical protein